MRCSGAILLIAIFLYFSGEVRSSNKFKELSKGNWNNLHGLKKTNCTYIKCPNKVDRACVRVKHKKRYTTKSIYISVINKCEIDYIRCHEDLEATRVPLEKCSHKHSADNPNTTKKRLKRSPHIVTKTVNNQVAKHSRKLLSQFDKSSYRNKYSSLYFGPKRKAIYIKIKTNNENDDDRNEEDNLDENDEADSNNDRETLEDGEQEDQKLMDKEDTEKEAQDSKTETEESLVGKDNDDRGRGDKQVISFDIDKAKGNVYSKPPMHKNSKIDSYKTNEDENVNNESFNENENVSKDSKSMDSNEEQPLDNFNNMELSMEDKLNDEKGHNLVNEDQTIIITFDKKDKKKENDTKNMESGNIKDKTELDNAKKDNKNKVPQQSYVNKIDSDRQTDNIHIETQKNTVDNVENKNDSNENEGPYETLNIDKTENPESEKVIKPKQKETILISINYKHKETGNNTSKDLDKNADIEKEKTKKKVTESDTSTEEDKKDVKTNDAKKPHDGKNPEKPAEDNYDDVNKDRYSNDCPTVCPARDVMLCARCKEGVYRTFMSACHLRMFNCKHPEEKLELVSRKPCILSAPFLNGMKTKGTVTESGDEDKVLRYIQCREKGDANNPKCNFGNRARKRRIYG